MKLGKKLNEEEKNFDFCRYYNLSFTTILFISIPYKKKLILNI